MDKPLETRRVLMKSLKLSATFTVATAFVVLALPAFSHAAALDGSSDSQFFGQLQAIPRSYGSYGQGESAYSRGRVAAPSGEGTSPLLMTPTNEVGSGVLSIPCTLGRVSATCQLDSGAGESLLQDNSNSESYPVVGHGAISGASGQPEKIDEVQLPDVAVGNIDYGAQVMARVPQGFGPEGNDPALVGINILSSNLDSLGFDFTSKVLRANAPISGSAFRIARSSEGHLILPVAINGYKGAGLWDTGASITVVDPQFIQEHPENFKLVGHTKIQDIAGNEMPAGVYVVQSVKIGQYDFQGAVAVGIKDQSGIFASLRGKGLAPMIIGYNLITRANWTMDFKNDTCSVSQARAEASPESVDACSLSDREACSMSISSSGNFQIPAHMHLRMPRGRITLR